MVLTATDDQDANPTIYYTTDGSNPKTSSTCKQYTSPISITSTTTLKFYAFDGMGNESPVFTETYTIDNTPPKAEADIKSGSYNTNKTVKLSMSEAGTIYYTKNGATPTTTSTKYVSPIVITATTTLKFIAVDEAGNISPVQTETYTIDTTEPTVVSSDPANNAVNVVAGKTIKVTFSEDIIPYGKFWVELKKGSTVINTTNSINGKVLTIDPTSNLVKSLYTICIHTWAVTDLAGNPVALKTSKFSVGTAPTVTKVDPADGANNVAPGKTIKITFNEVIKAGSMWIELKNSSGGLISNTKSISGNVLTINPTGNLPESKYKVILHTGAVTDLVGNPLAAKSLSFTVGTPPTVTGSSPGNGATRVVRDKIITVVFSERVKANGSYWIELKDSRGNLVTIDKSIGSRVLTITHTVKLKANTRYRLILHTGCVTDMAGNKLAAKTITFTTGST